MNSPNITLYQWYHLPFGQSVLRYQCEEVNLFLPKKSTNFLLQLGCTQHIDDLMAHRRIIFCQKIEQSKANNLIQGSYQQVPFPTETIDIVLAPHILETESDPQKVLEEIWRVICPEGYLILFGFNPWSLWSLASLFGKSGANFLTLSSYSTHTVTSWLLKLGAEIVLNKSFCFLPPDNLQNLFNSSGLIETLGKLFFPQAGGMYILIAQKHMIPLSPVKPSWRLENVLKNKGFAEPTAGRLRRNG